MTSFRALSWNLNGLDEKRLDQRMEKLCISILLGGSLKDAMAGKTMRPVPDIVALQEVIRRTQLAHLSKHFSAAGYELVPATVPDRSYYEMIAVRPPWRIVSSEVLPFEGSGLRRQLLIATLQGAGDQPLRVITAHMESLKSGSADRLAQTREIDKRLDASEMPTLFLGDTNLRAGEWSKLSNEVRMLDAFDLAGKPQEHRYTWWPETDGSTDAEECPEGEEDDGPTEAATTTTRGYRFDRVWLDPHHHWRATDLSSRRLSSVSDHASVEVTMSCSAR